MPLDQIDVDKLETKTKKHEGKEMSFLEHLEELRWHIVRSLVAILVVGTFLFIFYDWYFEYILLGPKRPDFISYRWFCQIAESTGLTGLCFSPPEFKAIATGLAETFILSFKMAFVGGLVIAFPYVFWEIWRFIRPGLYPNEKSVTRNVVFTCSLLFLTGVAFGYFFIAPFAINFLVGYTIPGVENTPTIQSLINYMVMFTLPSGLVFELPIVVYFLSKLGIVTAAGMRKYRRHSIVGILLVAAIVTPPDAVTMFMIGIPLFILYEISIFIAIRGEKLHQKGLTDED